MNSFSPLYIIAVLLLTCTACKKESNSINNTGRSIGFTSKLVTDIGTRASGMLWDKKDAIGIYMSLKNESSFTAVNKKYVTESGDGTFIAANGNEITAPETGKSASFIAYYPYRVLEQNIYPINLNDQSQPSTIDLLYSDNVRDFDKFNEVSPSLSFAHQLATLEILIKAGAGITTLNGLEATLENCVTEADFNLNNAVISNARHLNNISARFTAAGTMQRASLLLLPGNYAAGKTIRFKLKNGNNYSFELPANMLLEKGVKYTYSVVLKDVNNPEKIQLLVEANYETGTKNSGLSDLTLSGASALDAEYLVSPGATGKYAIAHMVSVGDEGYFSNNHWRSESATAQMFELGKYYNGDERRFEISILLKDWQSYSPGSSENGDIIFQGKQSGGSNPAWYLMTKRNQIAFRIARDQIQVPIVNDFRTYINDWIHFRIDAKMSQEANGYYKVYRKLPGEKNFTLKYEISNFRTFNVDLDGANPSGYLKWGLYRPDASPTNTPPDVKTRVIYHDDLRIYKLN